MDQAHIDETGYCVVCGQNSIFRFDPTLITPELWKAWGISGSLVQAFNLKESMFCGNCGSSLRIRRLAAVLMQTLSEVHGASYNSLIQLLEDTKFRQSRIAEINVCGALHTYLKKHENLFYSEWLSNVSPGNIYQGIRCEDLQCLTYPDNYFDIILTSETLEHVPDPNKAWGEIYRTLKPGGYHIFTIPVIPRQSNTIQRARIIGGEREYLREPAYHGAWGQEDMFVYTDFGMDVATELNELGSENRRFIPQSR